MIAGSLAVPSCLVVVVASLHETVVRHTYEEVSVSVQSNYMRSTRQLQACTEASHDYK